ncbi:polysaccharide deacetylase family protein [Halobacillus sp. Marseille-Q1614]|uniref:polysaccharide deacetylase family protein n=1 Tax=Halobacillus sp. Marseille-Q1614 TaxID=2709134 RepID=UPI00156E1B08|nr:polysaccharide deacetylase family protein [Halobacillus sp. Marseille-Q1614]
MKYWLCVLLLLIVMAGCGIQAEETVTQEEREKETTEEKAERPDEEAETEDDKSEEMVQEAEEVESQYRMTESGTFVPIHNANENVVLLTFDDAPDAHALEIAQTLKELEAPAIFFVNGHFLDTEEEKETLKQIQSMGFPIGNHTMSHPSLPELSEQEQREEIVKLNDIVEEIIGERPKFFRAPFGQNTEYTKQVAEEEGMLLMNWTYGYDWEPQYQNAESLADIMVNTEFLRPGANLLMHDREWTAKAVPAIVKGFRDKGYELLDPALIEVPGK